MPALTLALLEDTYAICRFPAGARVSAPSPGPFSLLVQAMEETTLVGPLDHAPAEAEIDAGWRCLRIAQSFDFGVPGILASVLDPKAAPACIDLGLGGCPIERTDEGRFLGRLDQKREG